MMNYTPSSCKGRFIVIDGPNGVGKTTVCRSLFEILTQMGYKVILTKEPTLYKTGRLAKLLEENGDPLSLACAVATDRYYHLFKIVVPALEKGYIVISDRYFPSSLVLQRIDGVDLEFILSINSKILRPDVTIILTASTDTLLKRLKERKRLSRFERYRIDGLKKEILYYKEAVETLRNMGWKVHIVNNEGFLGKTMNYIVEILRMEGII